MKRHRFLSFIMVVLMVVSIRPLFSEGKQEAAATGATGTAEIRFTWWGDTARHAKYNAIADIFEKQNSGVKIIREFGGWSDYWDKLATQTAGGNAPDVQGQHLRQVSDYARRGALLSLDDYVKSGVIDLSNFPATIRDAGKLDGKQLLVAQGYTVIGVFYNETKFDEMGVSYPNFRWTWEEYRSTLEKIRAADKSEGFWPSPDMGSDESRLIVYLTQRGKALFAKDGGMNCDVEDMTAWFELWDGLRKDGLVPDGATTQEYDGVPLEQSLIARDKIAVTHAPFNQLTLYQGVVGEGNELGLTLFPRMKDGKVGEELGASFLAIASTSRYPDVAARFINFFVNAKEAVSIFKLEQGALGSTESNKIITPLLNPIEQKLLDGIQKAADDIGSHALPPAGAAEVYAALDDAAQACRFGQLSPRQAAEQFVSRVKAILGD